jgi:lipid II:glycine glycyltransferase (peptidoglycan interpeptide bridge formation enzyme)
MTSELSLEQLEAEFAEQLPSRDLMAVCTPIVLFALVDGVAVAGELLVLVGDEAIAVHAASSTTRRVPGATALLVFEAMRWARARGCRWYDADGLASAGRPRLSPGSERVPGSSGGDLRGLDWFKLGFGGEIVSYPAPLERRYHPLALWLLRRSRPARAAVGRRARSWLGRVGAPPAGRLG